MRSVFGIPNTANPSRHFLGPSEHRALSLQLWLLNSPSYVHVVMEFDLDKLGLRPWPITLNAASKMSGYISEIDRSEVSQGSFGIYTHLQGW